MSGLSVPRIKTRARAELSNFAVPIVMTDREVTIPPDAHTLHGFRCWAKSEAFPERGRISFINGVILTDMSPEEFQTHNKVKTEIAYGIVRVNKRAALGEFFSDRTLITNVAAKLSTEPDAAFALWKTLESGRVRLVPAEGEQGEYMELEGTPDWVLEIISDSSVTKDKKRLRQAYHRAGIAEYWLVDARKREIDFQILCYAEDDYRPAAIKDGWQSSRIFKRRFRLTRRRGRMNLWQYTLQVKPLR